MESAQTEPKPGTSREARAQMKPNDSRQARQLSTARGVLACGLDHVQCKLPRRDWSQSKWRWCRTGDRRVHGSRCVPCLCSCSAALLPPMAAVCGGRPCSSGKLSNAFLQHRSWGGHRCEHHEAAETWPPVSINAALAAKVNMALVLNTHGQVQHCLWNRKPCRQIHIVADRSAG